MNMNICDYFGNRVNFDMVLKRNDLLEFLRLYKGILNSSIFMYLNDLIELDFSVLRDYIPDSERVKLAKMDLYREISIYNIYNRAMMLLNDSGINVKFRSNDNFYEGLNASVMIDKRNIELFKFDYKDDLSISLFQIIENEGVRELEINRILEELELLYELEDSHSYFNDFYETKKKIEYYEKRFMELDGRKELSDTELKEVFLSKYVHDLILSDYGLNNKSFDTDINISDYTRIKSLKKIDNINIYNDIRYL